MRKFHEIELQHGQQIDNYAQFLERFLRKDHVSSDDTRRDAENLLRERQNRAKARASIPDVWRTLLVTPDQSLCNLVIEAVNDKCQIKPSINDVTAFLKGQLADSPASSDTSSERQSEIAEAPRSGPQKVKPKGDTEKGDYSSSGGRIVGYVLNGQRTETGVANRTLAELLIQFQRQDSTFMERLARETDGRTRRLVHADRNKLYDKSDLRKYAIDLGNGWWFGTNLSAKRIRKHIETACRLMRIQFGTQLKLIER